MTVEFGEWVEISFDCLPLRSVTRFDVPDDASPKLAEKMLRVRQAVDKHGVHNTYFLHNASCVFHLTNSATDGMLSFSFEGVIFTDEQDVTAKGCDLDIGLAQETCSWINQTVVDWMQEAVRRAVLVDFERFIAAGDLSKTQQRVEELQKQADESGGFVGMYL